MEEFLSKIHLSGNQIDFHRRCVNAMDARTNLIGIFIRRGGKTSTLSALALAAALSGPEKELVLYSNQLGTAIELIKMYAKQTGVSNRLEYDEVNETFNVLDEGGNHRSTIHLLREGKNPCEEPMEADVFMFDLTLGDPRPKLLNTFIPFYASRGTPMIGMATEQREYFDALRSGDDTPLFEIKEYALACDACTDMSQAAKCSHYDKLVWGSYVNTERKREMVNAIISSCT